MIRNKDMFIEMLENGFNLFQNMPTDVTVEDVVINRNNVKTTVKVYFNKDGYAVYTRHKSEYVPSEKELKVKNLNDEIEKAVKNRNYKRAAELQEELENIK